MFALIANGIPWQDADGATEWPEFEIYSLAASVAGLGYHVEVVHA